MAEAGFCSCTITQYQLPGPWEYGSRQANFRQAQLRSAGSFLPRILRTIAIGVIRNKKSSAPITGLITDLISKPTLLHATFNGWRRNALVKAMSTNPPPQAAIASGRVPYARAATRRSSLKRTQGKNRTSDPTNSQAICAAEILVAMHRESVVACRRQRNPMRCPAPAATLTLPSPQGGICQKLRYASAGPPKLLPGLR
jgi:hypothetical protein